HEFFEYTHTKPTVDTSLDFSITENKIHIQSKQPKYRILGYYPQIISPSVSGINRHIRDTIQSLIRNWNNDIREYIFNEFAITDEINFVYSIDYADSTYLCINFNFEFISNRLYIRHLSFVFNYQSDRLYSL